MRSSRRRKIELLRDTFDRRHLVLFPEQVVTGAEQVAFCRHFGAISPEGPDGYGYVSNVHPFGVLREGFEEVKSNKMLANFVKYTGKDSVDGFAVSAWAATMLFQQALTDAVKSKGANGVTRANLFDALKATGQFNAGGLVSGADIGTKTGSPWSSTSRLRFGVRAVMGTAVRP